MKPPSQAVGRGFAGRSRMNGTIVSVDPAEGFDRLFAVTTES
jgi:hypothetical protein